MLELLRFGTLEHSEALLRGEIYMSSLGHFWNQDKTLGLSFEEIQELGVDDQQDIMEGIIQSCPVEELPFSEELKKNVSFPVQLRSNAFQYCNIVCFVGHHYDPISQTVQKLDSRLEQFGDYAVRIIDVDAFFNRVFAKAATLKDICVAGPVTYHVPDISIKTLDCFDKLNRFSYQQEWRIAYLHKFEQLKAVARNREKALSHSGITEFYDKSFKLHINNISDIATVVSTDDLLNHPQKVYPGYSVVHKAFPNAVYNRCFSGWNREQFRSKVWEIDKGKVVPIITIG